MSTSDAVSREAAWLITTGDGLPALRKSDGGPFDVVQAYIPRTPFESARSLYVIRHRISQPRYPAQRLMSQHGFELVCWWPLLDGTGSAETDQQDFDDAVDLVLQRIAGFPLDHTHGGRFLSVAENPRQVEVSFGEAMATITQLGGFHASITYTADDPQQVG